MPTVPAGASLSFDLPVDTACWISTTGEASATLDSGAPGAGFTRRRLEAGKADQFGPYPMASRLTVSCNPTPAGDAFVIPAATMAQQSAVMIGDSLIDNHVGFTFGGTRAYQARGFLHQLNQLLGAPWRFVGHLGMSGKTSGPYSGAPAGDWLSQLPAFVGATAGVAHAFIGFPTNDGHYGIPVAQSIANMRAIYAMLRAASRGGRLKIHQVLPVAYSATPAVGTTATARALQYLLANWMREYCAANDIELIDAFSPTHDPATLAPVSGAAYDSTLHPSAYGAGRIAAYNLARYQRRGFVGNFTFSGTLLTAAYNAQMAGTSSGLPLGWTQYTTGSPSGVTPTKVARTDRPGELARTAATATVEGDSWGYTQTVNLATAWSSIASTPALGVRVLGSYGDHWVCTTSGAKGGAEPSALAAASSIGQTATDGSATWTRVANIKPGTLCEAFIECTLSSISGGNGGAMPIVLINFGGSPVEVASIRINNNSGASDQLPAWPTSSMCVLASEQFVIPTGATSLAFFVYCKASINVAASLDLGAFDLRPATAAV